MEKMTRANHKKDIIHLLDQAEKAKIEQNNLKEAFAILETAKKMTSTWKEQEEGADGKASIANATFDSSVAEITYNEKLGHILYDLNEYDWAIQCIAKLRVLVPREHRVEKEYGDCLRKKGRYNEALEAYDQALEKWQANQFGKKPQEKAYILCSKGLVYLSLDKYEEALVTFEEAVTTCPGNPLFECNRGKALFLKGDRAAAQEALVKAEKDSIELLKKFDDQVEKDIFKRIGLKRSNLTYISQTLNELNTAIAGMLSDKLDDPDEFTQKREANLVNKNIEKMMSNQETHIQADVRQIQDVKEKVRKIKAKGNENLKYYYDGFLFTMAQCYSTSVVLTSGQVAKDTGNHFVTGVSTLVSFIPLIGGTISNCISTAWDPYQDARMTKAANNVTSFATTSGDFDELAQDALCDVILENKNELNELAVEDYILPKWQARFKKLIDALAKIQESIYGARYKKPLQKAGFQAASTIIEEHLASGKIYYDGKNQIDPIDLIDEVKVDKLKCVIRETLQKDLESHRKKLKFDPKLHAHPTITKVTPEGSKNNKKKCFFF